MHRMTKQTMLTKQIDADVTDELYSWMGME